MARRLLALAISLAICQSVIGCRRDESVLPSKAPQDVVVDFLRASRDVCEHFSREKPGVTPESIPPFQRYVMGKVGPFLSHSADEAFRSSFQARLLTLSEQKGLTADDPIYEFVDTMARMEYTIISHAIHEEKATVMTELALKDSRGELVRSERMEFQLVIENGRWVVTFESFSGGIPLPEKAAE